MAITSADIKATKTIREFLVTKLADHTIQATINSSLTEIENVDVIWDGANYYLAYSAKGATSPINIISLDAALPIVLTKTETST